MNNYTHEDELMHYGVLGMKWGVRRNTSRLRSASTAEQHERAVSNLNKHRAKATKKLAKLESKHETLDRKATKAITKWDTKAAKLNRKANKMIRKDKNVEKAGKMLAKSEKLAQKSAKAKAKLVKNERMTRVFKQGINKIDAALINDGKRYADRALGKE